MIQKLVIPKMMIALLIIATPLPFIVAVSPPSESPPQTTEIGKILISFSLGYMPNSEKLLLSLGAEFKLASRLHFEVAADYDPRINDNSYPYYFNDPNIGWHPGVMSIGGDFGRLHGLNIATVWRIPLSGKTRIWLKGGPSLIFYPHTHVVDPQWDPRLDTYIYTGLNIGAGVEMRFASQFHFQLGGIFKKVFQPEGSSVDPDMLNRFTVRAGVVWTVSRGNGNS